MQATVDIWLILFLAAAAQGVFLSVMLVLKKAKTQKLGQYLLSSLVLLFTITIAYYTTFWMKVNAELPRVLRIILGFTFLFGPLAWAYLRQTVYNRLPQRLWLHFIPFILVMVSMILVRENSQTGSLIFGIVQLVHLLVYAALNLQLAQKTGQNRWVRNMALSFAGYVLCFMIYDLLSWTGILSTQHDYMVSFGMTIFIYFIGYHGFKAPAFFTGDADQKYRNSALTENSIEYIVQKLDKLMEEEKLYTKGDLKLQEVAETLNLGVHALSQAINVAKDKKFTDYLNELRVEEAMRLMQEEDYQDAKLLAIALDAGFNNKTTFLNAFRKYTGQTPSEYRKNIAA